MTHQQIIEALDGLRQRQKAAEEALRKHHVKAHDEERDRLQAECSRLGHVYSNNHLWLIWSPDRRVCVVCHAWEAKADTVQEECHVTP